MIVQVGSVDSSKSEKIQQAEPVLVQPIINYNFHIANLNTNNNDYFSKMLANNLSLNFSKVGKQSVKRNYSKDNVLISKLDDYPNISIDKNRESRVPTKQSLQRVTTLPDTFKPDNLSTIQIDDSSDSLSFNSSLKEVYEKNQNSPELKRLRRSSLFENFFANKYTKKRHSETNSLSSHAKSLVKSASRSPRKSYLNINKKPSLPSRLRDKTRFSKDFNNSSSIRTEQQEKASPVRNRSSSFAYMKRMSQLHFNDIVENMKKDAMVKKNPNSYLFKDVSSFRSTKKSKPRLNLVEQQLDRLSEFYENLLEVLFKQQLEKMKYGKYR
jgi:hypothetical protein